MELLRAAQQGLHLLDVALRESQSVIAQGFEPRYEQPELEIQLMQHVLRSEQLEVSDDSDKPHDLFRVFVKLGVRWVQTVAARKRKQSKRKMAAESEEPRVLAQIEATFVTTYEIKKTLEQRALDEFAQHNAAWQVWPYWREYVASQSARMNLPKVTLPMQCVPTEKPLDPAAAAGSQGTD